MRSPAVCLRALTAEEAFAVEDLAHSRTAEARRVERARLIWRAHQGETPPAIAGGARGEWRSWTNSSQHWRSQPQAKTLDAM